MYTVIKNDTLERILPHYDRVTKRKQSTSTSMYKVTDAAAALSAMGLIIISTIDFFCNFKILFFRNAVRALDDQLLSSRVKVINKLL